MKLFFNSKIECMIILVTQLFIKLVVTASLKSFEKKRFI